MGVIALLQASFFPPVAVAVLGLVYFVLRPSSRGEVVSSDLNARSKEAAEDDEAGKKGKKGKKADPRDADRDVKKQLEKAIDAKRRGEQFKAAWLFEQGRLWVKAAECYQNGGDDLWAAQLYSRGADHKRSAEIYRRFGYPVEAAEALEAAGQLGDAGVCYTIAGDLPKAAALFQKADRPEQAAELYYRLGMYHQAGRLFEIAGAYARAADSYEQMLDSVGRKNLKAGMHIAKVLEGEERIDAAIRFLEALGEVLGALFVAMRHDHEEAALRLYREYREILAGPLLRGVEDDEYPAEPLGILFEKAEDYVPAARIARRLGQMRRAAGLFERARKDVQAGEAWEAADEPREAALAYERADEYERAAPLFEAAGDLVRAVHCYRQAGYHFEAGTLYKNLKEIDNAISSFQQVEQSDPHRAEARLELARLIQGKKRWDLAIDMYMEVLGAREATKDDIDDLGSLATCLEQRERFGEAAACWRTIANIDPAREGVESSYARLRDLSEQREQEVPKRFPYAPPEPSAMGPGGARPAGPDGFMDTNAADGLVMDGVQSGLTGLAAAGIVGDGGAMPAGLEAAPTHAGVEQELGAIPDGLGSTAPTRDADLYGERAMAGAASQQQEAATGSGDDEAPAAAPGDSSEMAVTDELDGAIAGFGGAEGPAVESTTLESPSPESTTLESSPMQAEFTGPAGDALVSFEAHVGEPATDDYVSAADAPPGVGGADAGAMPVGVGAGAGISVESQAEERGAFGGAMGVGDVDTSGTRRLDGVDPDATDTLEARVGQEGAGGPLGSFPMFASLDAAARATLGEFFEERTAAPGKGVLVGDDANDGLVLLARGNVEVVYGGRDKRLAAAPAVFGQEMLLTGDLPDIQARARTEARFLVLSRSGARGLAERDRSLATDLAKLLRDVPPLA